MVLGGIRLRQPHLIEFVLLGPAVVRVNSQFSAANPLLHQIECVSHARPGFFPVPRINGADRLLSVDRMKGYSSVAAIHKIASVR